MKCVVCKGSDIELKTVEEQIRTGRDIILVPINTLVCSNCGERYYNRISMKKIEEIKSKLKIMSLTLKRLARLCERKRLETA